MSIVEIQQWSYFQNYPVVRNPGIYGRVKSPSTSKMLNEKEKNIEVEGIQWAGPQVAP